MGDYARSGWAFPGCVARLAAAADSSFREVFAAKQEQNFMVHVYLGKIWRHWIAAEEGVSG